MKKILLSLAAGCIIIVSCTNSQSYKINGTVEDIPNGETVYLQEYDNDQLIKLDSAVISNGKFIFKGKQDSVVNRYITYMKGEKRIFTDFFLENGNIKVELGQFSRVTGTKDNDIYQSFKDKFLALNKEMNDLYIKYQTDTTLTEPQKESLIKEIETKDKLGMDMVYNTILDNINNEVGVYLLPEFAGAFNIKQQEKLVNAVPAKYMNDKKIKALKEKVDLAIKTAVGEKYINFSMDNPEGKKISLSDFISKNKYTLIDFWASWCGPCRKEMPNVVAVYNEFKDKGFGIVGVSLDENLNDWKSAITDLGMTWPQMSDLKGWESEGAKLYGINSIPATLLVNQDGIIVARNLRGAELKDTLEKLYNNETIAQ